MMKVNLIFRTSKPKFFSIERVFGILQNEIQNTYAIQREELAYDGGRPDVLLNNIIKFKSNKSKNLIYHITGDVHYIAIVAGRKSILTIHDLNSAIQGNFLKTFYIKLFWFWLPALFVKKITVISTFTKDELAGLIPFAKEKIVVIHNPIHPNFYFSPRSFDSEKPRILCIGTKSNKNLERVIQAVSGIKCDLHIIGSLSVAQQELLINFQVDYFNQSELTDEEVHQAYLNSDFVCFVSTYEGFGMPIIEAQATGRPVLTSNIGAMSEIADDSALLVDPYDIQDIRLGIQKIIFDENLRENLIKKGLENIKRFSVQHIAQAYIKLYKELN